MATDKDIHVIELRLQKLESRITYGGAAVIAIAAVFGFTGIKTISDAQTALEVEISEISEGQIASELTALLEAEQLKASQAEALRSEAADHVAAIRSERAEFCPDGTAIEAYGQCIFTATARGGHYTMNYGSANAACVAEGAKLCTIAEVRRAHAKGFSICAYGWVADLVREPGPSSDRTYNWSGTLALPISPDKGGSGCPAGFGLLPKQHIISQNADAFCCK
ncbi:MAG: hypothetical protein V2I76_12045 [Roseobacter sp.]|jgi:hypothetical protein|nr:hypothetical protein [Roseobacter sp.]